MTCELDRLIGLDGAEKERLGIIFTPSEIRSQASLWRESGETVFNKQTELSGLFVPARPGRPGLHDPFDPCHRRTLILSGAGSSGHVGRCLAPLFRRRLNVHASVFDTTDIVIDPEGHLIKDEPCLVVLFARSGDSPESLATYEIARSYCKDVRFLAVTCNPEGGLARLAAERPSEVSLILLDPSCNDKSLAMTSSFTNMVVAGQALSFLDAPAEYRKQAELMHTAAEDLIQEDSVFRELAETPFERAVFLGDGALYGAAAESALKVQELTDGTVMTMSQTFLGVRHGPKAVVNNKTLVVFYVSTDSYKLEYEADLIEQFCRENVAMKTMAVAPNLPKRISDLVNCSVSYGQKAQGEIDDDLRPPIDVIAGQLLGVYKALDLGFKPDAPSARGVISRVVKGVTIYPFGG